MGTNTMGPDDKWYRRDILQESKVWRSYEMLKYSTKIMKVGTEFFILY